MAENVGRSAWRSVGSVAAVMALGLTAACGGDDEASDDSNAITVMTIASVNSPTLTYPDVFPAAEAAVKSINDAGGINGQSLRLITCDDQADANQAAACARRAVDEGAVAVVGGIHVNGATVLPVLKEAGIAWIGPPAFTPSEQQEPNSFPALIGTLGNASIGYQAAKDGCTNVTSVHVESAATDGAIALVKQGVESAGTGAKYKGVRVPATTTDFSSVAKATEKFDCVILSLVGDPAIGFLKSMESLDLEPSFYTVTGALNDRTIKGAGGLLEGAMSLQAFKPATDPAWADAVAAAPDVDWSAPLTMSTWAAYQALAQVADGLDDVTADSVLEAFGSATAVDSNGLTAPIDYSKPFEQEGVGRLVNHNQMLVEVKDGRIVQKNDFADVVSPLFAN